MNPLFIILNKNKCCCTETNQFLLFIQNYTTIVDFLVTRHWDEKMEDCWLSVKQVSNNTHKQDNIMFLQHSGKRSGLQHEPFLKGLEKHHQKINYIISSNVCLLACKSDHVVSPAVKQLFP